MLGPPAVRWLTGTCLLLAGTVTWLAAGSAELTGRTTALAVAAALAVCVAVTESRPLHVAHGRERHTFTFSEAPLVVALALGPGRLLVAGFVLGVAASQLWRRLALPKVMFNLGQYALAVACATAFAVQLDGPLGVVAGIAAFAVVNDVAVQLVLRVTAGRRVTLPLRGRAVVWFVHVAAVTSAALLVGPAVADERLLALALVAPLVLVTLSKRETTRQRTATTVAEAIAAGAVAQLPAGRAVRAALLESVARTVLAADQAELVLLGPTGAVPDARTRAVIAAGETGLVAGHEAGVAIGPQTAPYAVLLLRREDDHEPFRGTDLDPLRLLAEHGARWLAEADDLELELDVLSSLTLV